MNDIASRKILLVDDEDVVREILGEFLALLDCQTEEAPDGLTGLAAVEKSNGYRAAFADIRMPGIDGIGFLKKIRIIRPDLPVIIISGHGSDDTRREAMDAGAFAYLRKPFRYQQVKDILDRIV